MKQFLILLVLTIFLSGASFAQNDLEKELSQYNSPDEVVTLSQSISYDTAIEILAKISLKVTGRNIVSTVQSSELIGLELTNINYMKALKILTQYRGLIIEEKPDVVVVKKPNEPVVVKEPEPLAKDIYAPIDAREVKISAIFFEADNTALRDRGINWQALLSDPSNGFGVDLKTFGQTTTADQTPTDFLVSGSTKLNLGDFKGNLLGTFRFFESENLGEIIANPSITVRTGELGKIQIGSDFSIKQRDFAGNVTDQFFSTGSIIDVTPHVYNEDGIDYVVLRLAVERSTAFPSELSTEIRKTKANSQLLMLNGEETVIGGLYVTDETYVRTGIPILKDLPWWVFGIRYLAGADQKKITKKEIIIVIKTELLPTLKDRMKIMADKNQFKEKLDEHRSVNDKIQEQSPNKHIKNGEEPEKK
ncbi:type II and III secretion system protein [Ignavibacteriales bacterium]